MTSPIANLKKTNMPPTEVKSFGNKEHRNSIQEKIKGNSPRLSKQKNDAGSQENLLFLMSKRISKLEDTVNQVTEKLERAVELIAMKDMQVEQLKAELGENGKKSPNKGKRIDAESSSVGDISNDTSAGESSDLPPITEGTVFDEKRKHDFLKELAKARADLKSAEDEYDSHDVHNVLNKNSDELEQEYLRLAKQVADMEAFLADYGLIWIGEPVTKDKGDDSPAVMQTSIIFSPDFNKIFVVIDELNDRAENESNIKYTPNGATFKKADILDLTLYADGIQLEDNDFRQYSSTSVQEFFRDLEDGYYPTELKGRHPEGVIFKIIDKRTQPYKEVQNNTSQPFSGKGHRLGSNEEVRKIPTYPGPSGRHLKSEGNKGDVKQMLEEGTAPYKPVMTRTIIYADVDEESDESAKKKPASSSPQYSKSELSGKSKEGIKSQEIISTKKKQDEMKNVTTSVTELDNGTLSRTVVDLDSEPSDVRSRPQIVKTVPTKVKIVPSVDSSKLKKPSEEKLIKVRNEPLDDDNDVVQYYEDKMGRAAQKMRRNLHPKETTVVREGKGHKKPLYRDNINVTNITYHEAPLYVTINDDEKPGKKYYRGRADLDGEVELDYVDDETVRQHPYYSQKYGAPSEYDVHPRTPRSADGYPRRIPYSADGDPRGMPYSADGDPRGMPYSAGRDPRGTPYSAEDAKRMYARQAYDAADAARGGRPPSIREGYTEYADRYGRTADAIREQYKREQQKVKHQAINPNEKFEHFTYIGEPNEVEPIEKVQEAPPDTTMKTHVEELDAVPEVEEEEADDGLTPKEINAGGLVLNEKTSKDQVEVRLRSTDGDTNSIENTSMKNESPASSESSDIGKTSFKIESVVGDISDIGKASVKKESVVGNTSDIGKASVKKESVVGDTSYIGKASVKKESPVLEDLEMEELTEAGDGGSPEESAKETSDLDGSPSPEMRSPVSSKDSQESED